LRYEGENVKPSAFNLPERTDLIHAAIGGGICFIIMFLILDITRGLAMQGLVYFGVVGVVAFREQFSLALGLILFGAGYLPAGFIGGLYTGYQTEENQKVLLAIPGAIGFIAINILTVLLGNVNVASTEFASTILWSLVGNVAGAYLGGYAINWPSEEEEESPGKFSVEF
jgi:hypothetical protein